MKTQFDVFNQMPKNTIDIFSNTGGGKTLGKKHDNNAIIEVIVDNDTFQNFAFEKTYGHPKEKSKRRYYMFYSIDADEYDRQHEIIKSKQNKNKQQ